MPISSKPRLLAVVFGYLVLVGLMLAVATAGVQAQNQGQVNGTNVSADVPTQTPEQIEGSVGPIDVMDYRLDDGTMILDVRVNQHTAYAYGDALAGTQTEGFTSFNQKQGTLEPGRRTLRLDVQTIQQDGEEVGAVSLATPRDAARIQTEALDGTNEPVPFGTAQGLLVGSAIFGAGGTWVLIRRRHEQDTKEATREL